MDFVYIIYLKYFSNIKTNFQLNTLLLLLPLLYFYNNINIYCYFYCCYSPFEKRRGGLCKWPPCVICWVQCFVHNLLTSWTILYNLEQISITMALYAYDTIHNITARFNSPCYAC